MGTLKKDLTNHQKCVIIKTDNGEELILTSRGVPHGTPKMDVAELIQLEYAQVHTPVEDLARTYNLSESAVRSIISTPMVVDPADSDLPERLKTLGELNQAAISRKFIMLQAAVLNTVEDLLSEVEGIEHTDVLKDLNNILISHKPSLMESDAKSDSNQGRFNIRILGLDGSGGVTNAIEISTSAGDNNGIGEFNRGVPHGTPPHHGS